MFPKINYILFYEYLLMEKNAHKNDWQNLSKDIQKEKTELQKVIQAQEEQIKTLGGNYVFLTKKIVLKPEESQKVETNLNDLLLNSDSREIIDSITKGVILNPDVELSFEKQNNDNQDQWEVNLRNKSKDEIALLEEGSNLGIVFIAPEAKKDKTFIKK